MPGVLKSAVLSTLVLSLHLAAAPAPVAAATARPLEPTVVLPADPERLGHTTPAVALGPDGSLLAVWIDLVNGDVVGRRLAPADAPGGAEEDPFVIDPRGRALHEARLARGADGHHLALWQAAIPHHPLEARRLDDRGRPLGETTTVAPSSVLAPSLVARPDGGFVVAYWVRSGGGLTLSFRRLAADGTPVGEAHPVISRPTSTSAARAAVAAGPDGVVTVSWSLYGDPPATSGALRVRSFSEAGEALGPVIELAPEGAVPSSIEHDLAAIGGDVLVAWAEGADPAPAAVWVRRLGADGPTGPAERVDDGTSGPFRETHHPTLALTPDGRAVVAWSEDGLPTSRVRARFLDRATKPSGEPFLVDDGFEAGRFVNGIDADVDTAGRLAFGWGIARLSEVLPTLVDVYVSNRARRFREVSMIAPPVPDAPPLVSAALPGFRTWAVITAGGVAVPGSKEDACVPETLCVSGRLPGRSEVFVRMTGPRPNGRLWPTLVKFTTSRVEVWIEQVATGEIEHYVLDEARPGSDELPGLFDREGFPPAAGEP